MRQEVLSESSPAFDSGNDENQDPNTVTVIMTDTEVSSVACSDECSRDEGAFFRRFGLRAVTPQPGFDEI